MKAENPSEQLARVFIALCDGVSTPFALRAKKLALDCDWAGIVAMTIDPRDYTDSQSFLRDNSIACFFKKLEMDIGINTADVALKEFLRCEKVCTATNVRFSRFGNNGPMSLSEARCLALLEPGREWLKRVLGPLPRVLRGRHGPGGTFDDRGRLTTVPDKMSSVATMTSECVDFLHPYWVETLWFRASHRHSWRSVPRVVRGNRFTTVPKTAKTDRGICIEPSFNVYLQLAVGDVISRRLQFNAGINKLKAQEIHRDLACRGSLSGEFATIDLSSASDTVSFELVKWLLPTDWFDLLASLRSPYTRIGKTWHRQEKFSSMGNGFTFELETLIFLAICHSMNCGESGTDFFCYGDDIIVPRDRAVDVTWALRFCGFTPNESKTFVDGNFRESCGGDFFNGRPVRGFYLKKHPTSPSDWIALANGLRRLDTCEWKPTRSSPVAGDPSRTIAGHCVLGPDRWFSFSFAHKAWLECLNNLPRAIRRFRGPPSLGDLVITSETFDRFWKDGIAWVRVIEPVLTPIPWHHWTPDVMMASILYGVGTPRGVMPRGSSESYRVGRVAFS